MTYTELLGRKRLLEIDIRNLLTNFTEDTGLTVDSIYISCTEKPNFSKDNTDKFVREYDMPDLAFKVV